MPSLPKDRPLGELAIEARRKGSVPASSISRGETSSVISLYEMPPGPSLSLIGTSLPGRGESFLSGGGFGRGRRFVGYRFTSLCRCSEHQQLYALAKGSPFGRAGNAGRRWLRGFWTPLVTARCAPAGRCKTCPMLIKNFGPCGCTGRVKSFLGSFFLEKRNESPVKPQRIKPVRGRGGFCG